MLPRVLIISTSTYRPDNQTRAADTYFHNWPKNNLIHLYSNSSEPTKGHSFSFFQITDYDMVNKILKRKKKVGKIYYDEQINSYQNSPILKEKNKGVLSIFKKRSWLRYYLRKLLWSKKRWLTPELEKWVSDFSPELIYCGASDDYFIMDISLFLSKKYNVPLIVTIGDDYYFEKTGFLLKPYKRKYKKIFNEIMETDGFAVYISDKIANKYNSTFKKQGFPIYLNSDINPAPYEKIVFEFNYFGNVELGRHKALAYLGDLLKTINCDYKINVYCPKVSNKIIRFLLKHNCFVHGLLSYEQVKDKMNSGAFNIVASGFKKQNIEKTRYSLSTKISDCLASSGPIIAIGPNDDGAIDYLSHRKCAIIVNKQSSELSSLKVKLHDFKYLKQLSDKAKEVYKNEHDIEKNRTMFEEACKIAVSKNLNNKSNNIVE